MTNENGLLKWTGIGLIGIGALFVVFGIYFIWYAHSAMWVETTATISSVQVRTSVHRADDSLHRGLLYYLYYPQIQYDYIVDGKKHSSKKWMLRTNHDSFGDRDQAVAAAMKYRNGDTITAYYNRDQPSVAVLQPGATFIDYIALLVGLFFSLTGWVLYKIRYMATSSSEIT